MRRKSELTAAGLAQGRGIAPGTPDDKGIAEPGVFINARLSWMKDVAAYKALHNHAITDVVQELNVIENSITAANELGLAGQSVRAFIQAQMDVAKAVQHRYCADWLISPELQWTPLRIEDARANIAQAGHSVLLCIARKLNAQKGFTVTDRVLFFNSINQEKVGNKDKERLWSALEKIELHP